MWVKPTICFGGYVRIGKVGSLFSCNNTLVCLNMWSECRRRGEDTATTFTFSRRDIFSGFFHESLRFAVGNLHYNNTVRKEHGVGGSGINIWGLTLTKGLKRLTQFREREIFTRNFRLQDNHAASKVVSIRLWAHMKHLAFPSLKLILDFIEVNETNWALVGSRGIW